MYNILIDELCQVIFLKMWCREPDSNRHRQLARRILSPLRLPIPPSRQPIFFDKKKVR